MIAEARSPAAHLYLPIDDEDLDAVTLLPPEFSADDVIVAFDELADEVARHESLGKVPAVTNRLRFLATALRMIRDGKGGAN